jgi:hypothetical protein
LLPIYGVQEVLSLTVTLISLPLACLLASTGTSTSVSSHVLCFMNVCVESIKHGASVIATAQSGNVASTSYHESWHMQNKHLNCFCIWPECDKLLESKYICLITYLNTVFWTFFQQLCFTFITSGLLRSRCSQKTEEYMRLTCTLCSFELWTLGPECRHIVKKGFESMNSLSFNIEHNVVVNLHREKNAFAKTFWHLELSLHNLLHQRGHLLQLQLLLSLHFTSCQAAPYT